MNTTIPPLKDAVKPKPRLLIATGGSGGHIFPGLAIAQVLKSRGFDCTFIGYGQKFAPMVKAAGFEFIMLPATKWNVRNPIVRLRALFDLVRAFVQAMLLVQRFRPAAVLGMGSYASVAAVMAAKVSGVPTIIHEQNVLPGRANRLLVRWVDEILLTFEASQKYIPASAHGKCQVVGLPLRPEVLAATSMHRDGMPFHLLIFGGSQGARVFADLLPVALGHLSEKTRHGMRITHQARPEDVERTKAAYQALGIQATVADFFTDLPARLATAHLVVGRAGTGTVVECAALGRAAILVPLRLADGHQKYNAQALADAGGALVLEEAGLTAAAFAETLQSLMADHTRRTNMEAAARTLMALDGAEKAANEVIHLVKSDIMHAA